VVASRIEALLLTAAILLQAEYMATQQLAMLVMVELALKLELVKQIALGVESAMLDANG